MSSGADTDKIIELLEEEAAYLKGECDRWYQLYMEEVKARKFLQDEIRKRFMGDGK